MNISFEKITPPVAFVLVGLIMIIIGATEKVPFLEPQQSINSNIRITIFIFGILFVMIGPIFVFLDTYLKKFPRHAARNQEETDKKKLSSIQIYDSRYRLPPLEERLKNVKSLYIAGMSLLAISTQNYELLFKKIDEKCEIKLLLLNPENETLMKSTCIFVGNLNQEEHRQEIITSINTFVSDPTFLKSGLVEIRIYDYPLTHGIFITDGENTEGKMHIEMYIYKKRGGWTPRFPLVKKDNPELFSFFLEEFKAIWNNASPYQKWIMKKANQSLERTGKDRA